MACPEFTLEVHLQWIWLVSTPGCVCTYLNGGGTGSTVDQGQLPKATRLTDGTHEILVDINLGKARRGEREGGVEGREDMR